MGKRPKEQFHTEDVVYVPVPVDRQAYTGPGGNDYHTWVGRELDVPPPPIRGRGPSGRGANYPSEPDFNSRQTGRERDQSSTVGIIRGIGHVLLATYKLGRGAVRVGNWAASTRAGRVVGGMTAATIAFTYFYAANQDSAEAMSNCNDYGHVQLEIGNNSTVKDVLRYFSSDNKTWSSIASTLQSERGYAISADDVARSNPGLSGIKGNSYSNSIDYRGAACIAVPGFDPAGIIKITRSNADLTVQDYATKYNEGIAELVKLNPGLTGDPNQKLGVGEVLEIHKPDTNYVLRPYTAADLAQDTAKLNSSDPKVAAAQKKLDDTIRSTYVNPRDVSVPATPEDIKSNTQIWDTPVVTDSMIKNHLTWADYVHEYADDYRRLGPDQTIRPAVTKPVIDPKVSRPTHHMTPYDISIAATYLMEKDGTIYGKNAGIVMRILLQNHLSALASSALTGNFFKEGGLDPERVQGGPDSPNMPAGIANERGYGIEQLTSAGRQNGEHQFALKRHTNDGDLTTEVLYALQELRGPYHSVLDRLMHAKTATTASDIVMGPDICQTSYGAIRCHGFENPQASAANQQDRRDVTADIYQLFERFRKDATPKVNPAAPNLRAINLAAHPKIKLSDKHWETTTGQSITDHVGNIIYFSQTDPRWNTSLYLAADSNPNDKYNRMGWDGCGPTTLAMLASTLTGREITPWDMANYMMRNGFVSNSQNGEASSNGQAGAEAVGKALGAEVVNFDHTQTAAMETFVKNGGFIVVAGTDVSSHPKTPFLSAGHVIFLRKFANGHFYIGDPANYAHTAAAWKPSQVIVPEHKLASGAITGSHYFVGIKMPAGKQSALALK